MDGLEEEFPVLEDLFDSSIGAPEIMVNCIEFLRKHGMSTVGLFRTATDEISSKVTHVRLRSDTLKGRRNSKADSNDNESVSSTLSSGTRRPSLLIGSELDSSIESVDALKDENLLHAVNSDSALNEEDMEYSQVVVTDVDNVAGILKMFLRDLEEPLITFIAHVKIIECTHAYNAKKLSEGDWIDTVNDILETMPKAHRATFFYFVDFLSEVAKNSHINKMSASNLAIVFAPAIMRYPPEVEKTLLPEHLILNAKLSHKALEKIIVELAKNDV